MKKLGIVSFTERGGLLADRLSALFGEEYEIERYKTGIGSLREWCGVLFADRADGILFVGACGIAVRAIAPFLQSKTTDPAVIVLDEAGQFAISLLSGHLGGANLLARRAAAAVGAVPVITTATDVNGKFAVDVFAKENGLAIGSMKAAKEVSAAILRGEPVGLYCEGRIEGTVPPELVILDYPPQKRDRENGADAGRFFPVAPEEKSGARKLPRVWICISEQNPENFPGKDRFCPEPERKLRKLCPEPGEFSLEEESDSGVPVLLWLQPRTLTLGVGCRRGKPGAEIRDFVSSVFSGFGIAPELLAGVASIDLKKEEAGLLSLCDTLGLPLTTWSAEELMAVQGDFTASEFVRSKTGADNVCERAALRLAGSGGKLIVRKQAANGITAAVARRDWVVRFSEVKKPVPAQKKEGAKRSRPERM